MPPVPPERSRNQRLAATPTPLQLPGQPGWGQRCPRGRPCRVSPTRPSPAQRSACKWNRSRRNPSSKSSSVSCSCREPEALGRARGAQHSRGHRSPVTGHRLPAPFQTADPVIPSWFSEADANSFPFSFLCQSETASRGMKQNYYHTISRVCL